MKRRTLPVRKRDLLSPQTIDLVKGGLRTFARLGAIGWIALVSIVALLVAGYAIHAVVEVATKT